MDNWGAVKLRPVAAPPPGGHRGRADRARASVSEQDSQSLRAPQTRARVNLGVTPSTRRALGRAKIEDSTSVPPRGLGPGRGRPEGLCGGGRWWLGIDGVGILGDSGHAGGHGLENVRVAAVAAAATLHKLAPPPPARPPPPPRRGRAPPMGDNEGHEASSATSGGWCAMF